MIYRMRVYMGIPASADAFDGFFRDHLLPIQLRHGARLVGRWRTDDDRVVASWEYDDEEHLRRITDAVRSDTDSAEAQDYRRAHLPELFTERSEALMWSTMHE